MATAGAKAAAGRGITWARDLAFEEWFRLDVDAIGLDVGNGSK
jgi:hypothetical protein